MGSTAITGRGQTLLTLLGVCLLTVLPVVSALVYARHQAVEREARFLTNLAGLLLARTEATADQLVAGRTALAGFAADPCGDRALDKMRRIDLDSTMLQAVGHISGNTIDCSSFGGRRAYHLGPPTLVSRSGVRIWTNAQLMDSGAGYVIVGSGDFVGIAHRQLPLSFIQKLSGLSIGAFDVSTGHMLFERRAPRLPRFSALASAPGVNYRRDATTAVVRSNRYDLGAYATVAPGSGSGMVDRAALVLVPLALIVGLLLSLLFVRAMRARTSMPGLIRWGLRNKEFHVLLQPVVDLATGQTVGAEALVRWVRANGEIVPPDTFIPVAEGAGVIRLLTARVLALLEPEVGRIRAVQPDFRIAVNFSADDIHWPGIAQEVAGFLARSRLPAANLVIEATERSFVDAERALATLHCLREAGVTIAIDDFGTGYSSLGYLAQLEIDCIKVDRLFVKALGTESATSQVAARIIDMARDLGVSTVAEGVETADQARRLKSLGVNGAQGFLYGEPMTVDDLIARLVRENAGPGADRQPDWEVARPAAPRGIRIAV